MEDKIQNSSIKKGNFLKAIFGRTSVQTLLALLFFLLLWELIVYLFKIRSYVLPPPSEILVALFKYRVKMFTEALYTIRSMFIGYFAAIILGVLMAVPIAFSKFMQRTIYPLLVFSQLIPKVALAPIFIIWFGFRLLPKIIVVFLLSYFPVVLNAIVALRTIDQEIINLTRSTGASRLRTFFRVRLPNSLPTFFTGFKLAAISATIGAVIGEFIGSDAGLGFIILTANGDLQTDMSFAAIIILTLIGLFLYFTIEFLEHMIIPWHVSQRGLEETISRG
ncbi:MAG TPA: ABC transporter permease [Spirochaetia bacterium]|nr:ABC transporter permease [Spirochaetia bacterium]